MNWKTVLEKLTGLQSKVIKLAGAEGENVLPVESVVISDRAVGGKVEKKNEDDTLAPLADGTYTLSDGFKFTVVGGFITVIGEEQPAAEVEAAATPATIEAGAEGTPPAAPVTPVAAEGAAPVTGDTVEMLRAEVDALKAQLAELMTMLSTTADLANQATTAQQEVAAGIVALSATIESVANNIPATPARSEGGLGVAERDKAEKLNYMQRTAVGMADAANETLNKKK